MTAYVYDQGWNDERARLAGIEAMWDAGTREVLTGAGVRDGAAVLEAGAGGGSITSWLAGAVGTSGRVLAVDLDTRFVDELASPTVEVQQADVVSDALPEDSFDVVHARLLIEHLPERDRALTNLVGALRPGGTLVVEDYDWTPFGFESASEVERGASGAVIEFMTRAGFDPAYGRRLVGTLAALGLEDVTGAGRSLVIDTSHPGFAFFRLSFEQLAPATIQAGLLSEGDATEMRERLAGTTTRIITPTLIAATARKPSARP